MIELRSGQAANIRCSCYDLSGSLAGFATPTAKWQLSPIPLQQQSCIPQLGESDCPHTCIFPCGRTEPFSFEACLMNPPASAWSLSRTRRLLDMSIALLALLTFAVPMLIIVVSVRLTSKGNALFSQERVGVGGRLFRIYKFRSMEESCGKTSGPGLTREGDLRVTPIGRLLRKLKLDELPQFYNILRGDMSLIGPRPKLPQYAAMMSMPYMPGISGAATIAFRHGEEILRNIEAHKLDQFYAEHIKPVKAHLDACYMCKASLSSDMRMLTKTFLSCVMPRTDPIDVHPTSISIAPRAVILRRNATEASSASN